MRTTLLIVSAVLCIVITGSKGLEKPPFCTSKETCYPSQKELKEFGESLDGRLIFKNQKEYEEQSEMYNVYEQKKFTMQFGWGNTLFMGLCPTSPYSTPQSRGKQVFYLTDEEESTGKGANSVVSFIDHYLRLYGLGETSATFHFDNCTGQNKNNIVLWYAAWRVMTGQHNTIQYATMIAGHTKFAPDWHFGIWKSKWRSPNVIVMVQGEQDIRAAILFAKTYNLRVAIRSSGHSYVGRSTADDAFVINLSDMRDYEIKLKDKRHKDGVLKTQTGITWEELYEALDQVDRVAVGPLGSTVSPGGYTLGGGNGVLSPTLGYAVDNLLEVRVVLVDGSYATCTERKTVIERVDGQREVVNDGDLFWALKGGGGGTFGVVVHLVFKIHKAPESLVVFRAAFPLESDVYPGGDLKTEAFNALFSAFPALSNEWGGNWVVDNIESMPEQPHPYRGILHVVLVKFAPWDGSEPVLFSDLLNLSSTYNLVGELINMTTYAEFVIPAGSGLETSVNVNIIGTFLLPQVVGAPLVEWYTTSIFAQNQNAKVQCVGVMLGGATKSAHIDTPLHPGHRQAAAFSFCLILVEGNDDDDEHIQEVEALAQSLKALGYGEYFNGPTKNNQAWKEDNWGMTNYQRLLGIKYRYDPTLFLTCHHCVASEMNRS